MAVKVDGRGVGVDIHKAAVTLIEVIGIKEDNCINCHQCISVCPVKICSDRAVMY